MFKSPSRQFSYSQLLHPSPSLAAPDPQTRPFFVDQAPRDYPSPRVKLESSQLIDSQLVSSHPVDSLVTFKSSCKQFSC